MRPAGAITTARSAAAPATGRASRASAPSSDQTPSASISRPRPTITRNDQNTTVAFGAVAARERLEPGKLAVPGVGQDEAAEARDLDREVVDLALHVGPAEQHQRHALAGPVFPVAFDGGDLRRLVLQRVEAVQVADQDLDRRDEQQHPHRHRHHGADRGVVAAAQQMPGARRADDERRREEGGDRHVRQPIRERGVEDHRQPVGRHDPAVDDGVALRRLHPAVRGQDPGRRDQGSERHHQRREEVQPRADACPAEQHHAEEAGLEEERSQHLVGQQRPGDGRRRNRRKRSSWCRTGRPSPIPRRRPWRS